MKNNSIIKGIDALSASVCYTDLNFKSLKTATENSKRAAEAGEKRNRRNMEVRYLQEFLVLASRLNYYQAADELNLPQSSLSRHIQSLEKELGQNLIDRSSKQISLTEFGKLYQPLAEKIWEDYVKSENAVKKYIKRKSNSFLIGVPKNFQYYGITESLINFRKKNPEFHYEILEGSEPDLCRLYQNKTLHIIAACHQIGDPHEYEFVQYRTGYMVALLPKTHPFSGLTSINLSNLADEDLLLLPHDSQMARMVRKAFSEQNIYPNVVYEGSSTEIFDFIKAEMGIAIMPVQMGSWKADDMLVSIPVEPKIRYEYGVGYNSRVRLSDGERTFIRYYQELSETETEES